MNEKFLGATSSRLMPQSVQAKLSENGVGSFVYYPVSVDKLPVYKGMDIGPLPNTDLCTTQALSLPIWPKMTADVGQVVVDTLKGAL